MQLNEEYFNVGLTFELCMRAFGEMDIIHEEQLTDEKMNGYDILVLADVKMLPAQAAVCIDRFVRRGGMVIADCVPPVLGCVEGRAQARQKLRERTFQVPLSGLEQLRQGLIQ